MDAAAIVPTMYPGLAIGPAAFGFEIPRPQPDVASIDPVLRPSPDFALPRAELTGTRPTPYVGPGRLSLAVAALRAAPPCALRTNASSIAEYEARWHRQLVGRPANRSHTDLKALMRCSSYGTSILSALIDHQAVRIPAPDFFEWRGLWLSRVLRSVAEDISTVIEIGAGAGKNLPSLIHAGFKEIFAVEPTEYGCAALSDLGRHLSTPIHVIRAELPALPFGDLGRAVVLTNHTLEQMPGRVESAIDSIANLGDVRVVNIEPSLNFRGAIRHPALSMVDFLYRNKRKYSHTMSVSLWRRASRKQITLIHHGSSGYSPRVVNVPTLAIWEPRRQA